MITMNILRWKCWRNWHGFNINKKQQNLLHFHYFMFMCFCFSVHVWIHLFAGHHISHLLPSANIYLKWNQTDNTVSKMFNAVAVAAIAKTYKKKKLKSIKFFGPVFAICRGITCMSKWLTEPCWHCCCIFLFLSGFRFVTLITSPDQIIAFQMHLRHLEWCLAEIGPTRVFSLFSLVAFYCQKKKKRENFAWVQICYVFFFFRFFFFIF